MTLQVGIIGTGNFSFVHARILTKIEGVKIKSICGTSLVKAELMASKFNHAKGYDNLIEMLDSNHLDAVYICVPPMAHGKIELELIKREIPFFVEKPLGLDKEIPLKVLTEIQKKSLLTSVGYHFRYTDSVKRMKELVNEQNIGIVLGQYMGSLPKVSWWKNRHGSGGQFIEQTTHIVDLLRFICGEVDEVYSIFGNQVLHKQDESITVADVGTVSLRLRNGIVANISNTCILPDNVTRSGITLYTDKGIIDWSPDCLKVKMNGLESEYIDSINLYQTESEAFIYAVQTGDKSRILSDYEDSYKTHQVTYAALESAIKETPITLGI